MSLSNNANVFVVAYFSFSEFYYGLFLFFFYPDYLHDRISKIGKMLFVH